MSHFLRGLLGTLLVMASPQVSRAALVELDFQQLTARSRFIVCGEVVDLQSFWGEFGGAGEVLLTDVRIRVSEVWKRPAGEKEPREITVRLLGGKIGDRWQRCLESPRFERGERVLVFARPWRGQLWVSGWRQGKYRVTGSGAAARVEGKPHRPLSRHESLSAVKDRVRALLTTSPPVSGARKEVTR